MRTIVLDKPGFRVCVRIDVVACPEQPQPDIREVKVSRGQVEQALFLAALKALTEATHN